MLVVLVKVQKSSNYTAPNAQRTAYSSKEKNHVFVVNRYF